MESKIRGKKIALNNLGCKVNAWEGERMLSLLSERGALIVDNEEDADVVIINTCSVTNIADRKSRQMLSRARIKNPDAIIVAAGCYVEAVQKPPFDSDSDKKEILADILIKNGEKEDIAKKLETYLEANEYTCACKSYSHSYSNFIRIKPECQRSGNQRLENNTDNTDNTDNTEDNTEYNTGYNTESDRTRAFLKVQDGCNQFCSYCLIPFLRGKLWSRPVEACVEEAKRYQALGHKEIVITGIHLSSYGLEPGGLDNIRNNPFPGRWLLDLVRSIAGIGGVERIRLGSLEPRIITEDFVKGLSEIPEICPHFHLSLQSGSDKILRAMKRKYTTADFIESVRLIRSAFPLAAITGDVISGFPGESVEDFDDTCRFISGVGFYELHVFKYSRRRGTYADKMDGQITEAVKRERSGKLIQISKQQSEKYRETFLQRTVEMLPEKIIKYEGEEYLEGFSREYIPCLLPINKLKDLDISFSSQFPTGFLGSLLSVKGIKICNTYLLADSPEIIYI